MITFIQVEANHANLLAKATSTDIVNAQGACGQPSRVSQIQLKEYEIRALSELNCALDKKVQDAAICNLLYSVEQPAILVMLSYGTDGCHCLPFYREDLFFFGL
jgi:hypothetical protein